MLEWVMAAMLLAAQGAATPDSATPASAPAPKAVDRAAADAAIESVLPQVSGIRGLEFKRKVPVEVIDVARARKYARARFEATTPATKITADQKAFELLGLIPPCVDVLDTLLDVLEEQAGGFYDPGAKRFYLLDTMPKEMAGAFAAHEMTHALEDQYYDIDGRLAKIVDDDDATFALSSVAEGSASLAMAIYIVHGIAAGKMQTSDLEALRESDAGRAKRLDAMPGVLRKELLAPYVLGALFLQRGAPGAAPDAFPKSAVDAAWADPPRSSEQILHPAKYWDKEHRDLPKPVTLGGVSQVLGNGWIRAGSGILGEIAIGGLVGAPSPTSHDDAAMVSASGWTNAAASGWGGDRWELWTHGGAAVVLLKTLWDSPQDAVEFEAALPTRPGLAFQREGSTVAVVAGDPEGKMKPLLAVLAGVPIASSAGTH